MRALLRSCPLLFGVAVCFPSTVAGQAAARESVPYHGASPKVSPDGKHVLFGRDSSGHRMTYVMDADGSNERRALTDGAFPIDWLPDGRRIIARVGASRTTPGQLVTMNLDGSDPRELNSGVPDLQFASVFSNGKRMLVGSAVRNSSGRATSMIFSSMDMDGSNARPVPLPAIDGRFLGLSPSHDGRRVAFVMADTSDPTTVFRSTTLYVMNIDGSGLKTLATLPDGLESPTWSYDGRRIAVQHDDHFPRPLSALPPDHVLDCVIAVVDAASGAVHQITHQDRRYLDEVPSWSPDGHIYVQSNRDGQMDIYRMNADGTKPHRITGSGTPTRAASPAAPLPKAVAAADDDSIIVSPAWLAARIDDPSLAVLFVSFGRDSVSFSAGHLPGARPFQLASLTLNPDGMPPAEQVRALLERAGVSTNMTLVLYGNGLPRILVVLKYFGLRAKLLDGGLTRWTAEGRPVSNQVQPVVPGHLTLTLHPELLVDASWVQAHLNKKGVVLFDTRTVEEYEGGVTGPRSTKGHIPGAVRIAVEDIGSAGAAEFKMQPMDQVRRLYSDRAQPGDTIVTYCAVGNRASTSFLAALQLGYPARIYLGSYQDWEARGLPIVAGGKP